jgi:PhoPQ-activated pathogenicity-related protein
MLIDSLHVRVRTTSQFEESHENMIRKFLALAALAMISAGSVRADLHAYVKQEDKSFRWEHEKTSKGIGVTVHTLKLHSQTWQGILWTHRLEIVEPAEETIDHPEAAILFIGGGAIGDTPRDGDRMVATALARAARTRVAILNHVPNQPLMGDRKEDALIAETFIRYLDSKDVSWPLLFPMAKSAVRAMDATQEWAKKNGKPAIESFVVTGASKRGWTTWLSGAADPRVIAIAPMVIDTLNLGSQGQNQLKVWGKYSEQIHDYVERGLMQAALTPEGEVLWKMVDPYTYRDGRLAQIPKVLVNGTNDRYWTQDASRLYFPELKGPKAICYLPNAGHGLDQNREWALNTIAGLYRMVAAGKSIPKISWEMMENPESTEYGIAVSADPKPKAIKSWAAKSKSRDVRQAKWEEVPSTVSEKDGKTIVVRARPKAGVEVMILDLTYEIDGLTVHFSTQISESDRTEVPEAQRQNSNAKAAE